MPEPADRVSNGTLFVYIHTDGLTFVAELGELLHFEGVGTAQRALPQESRLTLIDFVPRNQRAC